MDNLLFSLYELAARLDRDAEDLPDCYALRERHLGRVREAMGAPFCEKLRDAADECAQLDAEAAFLRACGWDWPSTGCKDRLQLRRVQLVQDLQ